MVKKKQTIFDKMKATIAPGIFIKNDSECPILVVLSQLTPLHWSKVTLVADNTNSYGD